MTEWQVYICQCADGSLYTGITTNLPRRMHEHNHTASGARYTRSRRPVSLVYAETMQDRSTASAREYSIKTLTREEKLDMITSWNSAS